MSYEVESAEVTHDGVLSTVVVERVRMPDGEVADREVVRHADAVAVVPVDDDGNLVLLRHYRHPVRQRMLEIPAGKLDVDGEDPADAARREVIEEVGLSPQVLEPLVRFANSSGWTDEHTTVYLGRDLRPAQPGADFTPAAEESDLEVLRMPLAEAASRAAAGEIADAKTLIGILLAARRLLPPEPTPA